MTTPAARLAELDQLRTVTEQLYGQYCAAQAQVTGLQTQLATAEAQVQLLTLTEAVLTALLQQVSAESLANIEQTVTYGLRTVFDDHPLSFRFAVSQQRGGQSLDPLLTFKDVEAPVLGAFGGGPASVVAFLLRLLVCQQLGLYPVLLLDESFAMVSKEYIPNVATLLRDLAQRLGMTFLLVSHQTAFLQHADRAYEIYETSDGTSFRAIGAGS